MPKTEPQINWDQPLKFNPKDYTEEEFDLFYQETGQELILFLKALGDGEIDDISIMIGSNRKAIFTLTWLQFRREHPSLTRDQVSKQGAGIITAEILRRKDHVETNGNSTPTPQTDDVDSLVGPQSPRWHQEG